MDTPTIPRAIIWTLFIFLLGVGLFLILSSFASFEFVRAQLNPLAFDGSADFYTRSLHGSIQFRALLFGLFFLTGSLGTLLFRELIITTVDEIPESTRIFLKDLKDFVRDTFKNLSWIYCLLLVLILVNAIGIRLYYLDQPVSYDEAYSYVNYASQPVYVTISFYNKPNQHLLNSLLMKSSSSVFGSQPWGLRIAVFLSGVLSVFLIFLLGKYLHTYSTGLISASLMSSSYLAIRYSSYARGYVLQLTLFIGLIGLIFYLRKNYNVFGWGLFCLLSALAFWTIPTSLYLFGFLCLWWCISYYQGDFPSLEEKFYRTFITVLALTGVITIILYSPVLVVSGPGAITSNQFVQPLPMSKFIEETSNTLTKFSQALVIDFPYTLIALICFGLIVGVSSRRDLDETSVPLSVGLLFIPFVLLIQRVVPPFRVWTFLLPVIFLYASLGLASITVLFPEKKRQLFVACLSVLLVCWPTYNSFSNRTVTRSNSYRDTPAILEDLKEHLGPKDDLGFSFAYIPPTHYYGIRMGLDNRFLDFEMTPQENFYVVLGGSIKADLEDNMTGWKTLLMNKSLDPGDFKNPTRVKQYDVLSLYSLSVADSS